RRSSSGPTRHCSRRSGLVATGSSPRNAPPAMSRRPGTRLLVDNPRRRPPVGKLIYTMNVSLDGYVESSDGGLDWTGVDHELHAWFTEELRPIERVLSGRGL